MDCADVMDALRDDDAAAEAAAHLASCPECAGLSGGEWTGALRGEPAATPVDLDALQAGLATRLAAEKGVLAWFHARPTWQRRLALVLLAVPYPLVMVFAQGWSCPREDLAHYPVARYALELGCFLLLALAGVWTALRPAQRPAPRPVTAVLLGLIAVAAASGLALLPIAHEARHPEMTAPHCLAYGLQFGLPLALFALLFSRWVTWSVIALAGLVAGMFAEATLHVLCPDPRPAHLLLGHASVVAIWVALTLLAGLVRDRLARPQRG